VSNEETKHAGHIAGYAVWACRDYVTPEDIQTVIDDNDATVEEVRLEVLELISQGRCEDPKLCAFVAFEFKRSER
jgi:hypothetical protein